MFAFVKMRTLYFYYHSNDPTPEHTLYKIFCNVLGVRIKKERLLINFNSDPSIFQIGLKWFMRGEFLLESPKPFYKF